MEGKLKDLINQQSSSTSDLFSVGVDRAVLSYVGKVDWSATK